MAGAGSRAHRRVVAAVALGGMLGASARYALELAWPPQGGAFPGVTFATNVSGCLFIGVLMVFVVEVGGAHPLARPFLGIGVLGGFTTFSTYAVQTATLLRADRPAVAMGYLFGTLVAAMAAVVAGVVGTRALLRLRHGVSRRRKDTS